MDLSLGYHLTLEKYDARAPGFVTQADMPDLTSVAFLQYSLAGSTPNLVLDVVHLPTSTARRLVLDGPTPGAPTTIAAMRSIGNGRLLLCYQTGASYLGGSVVYLQVVDANAATLTAGDPAALFDPADNPTIPASQHTYMAPPGVHQVTDGDFVACYLGLNDALVPDDGVYQLGTYTCPIVIVGTSLVIGDWEAGPARTLTGTPGASCAPSDTCPLWVDEAVTLTALVGPDASGADDVPHLASAIGLRFLGTRLVAIDHGRLRPAAGHTLTETWSEPYYGSRLIGHTNYMTDGAAPETNGRRLYLCRLGGVPAEQARTTEFFDGLRGVQPWFSTTVDLDAWRQPTSVTPDIWQTWNADETEVIYRFRAGNVEVDVLASTLQSMVGATLEWVYADPGYGGVYDEYPRMSITSTGYLVAFAYGYGHDELHVSIWHLGGLSTLTSGRLVTTGYFS